MKILICRLFVWLRLLRGVVVFYDCLPKKSYLTITLTKFAFRGHLEIGNDYCIECYCNSCGTIISHGQIYGYATFDHGFILFKSKDESMFGYGFWGNKRHRVVSCFATYKAIEKENLYDVINKLTNGPKGETS